MNRKMRREQERNLKKKLTPAQYDDLKAQSNMEFINGKVREQNEKLLNSMVDCIYDTLRENKISAERSQKIVNQIADRVHIKLREDRLSDKEKIS